MSALVNTITHPTLLALGETIDRMDLASTIHALVTRLTTPANPSAPKPHISPGSDHFLYAVLATNGLSHVEACLELNLKPRTVERWKNELRKTASAYYGREVEYDFVAREIIDAELSRLQPRQVAEIHAENQPRKK